MPTTTSSAANGQDTLERDLDALKKDLSVLKADLATVLQSFLAQGEAGASRTGDSLDAAKRRFIEQSEQKIRQRPLVALLIAFVIGLVFGQILRR
jgi:ElaB/YqjD/DUF883 family membrane-anchored ribosome-binding protein